ncbi:ROK family protein [Croceimicrobium hydrocarbonivorans]|uniref:ROK family protein n=1 Tax=Croceimicrobium hydrocarbonivorans TaxID=2761580 RepID=A0A7H0VJB9_9FLAO|nr:ROK family protein [Croceimicrobium hydrocarbonivorans]QNR25817.1 ROK family protein [Croceimicrobium hydrocarbonivorans]
MEVSIGIDIGGTNSPYGIVTEKGEVLAKGSVKTRDYNNPEEFARALSQSIKESLSELGEELQILGIGIGAPNGNHYQGTIEFAPNLPWKGVVNLIALFQQHFTLPIYVTNDANAATIGEYVFGKAKGLKDFMVVTLGTGVGSGFVSNGELIYGHDSFAGELGHTIIVHDGRDCACGRKGCLETYASVTGLLRTAQIMLAKSSQHSILRNTSMDQLSGKDIGDAAAQGDKLALDILDYTAKRLAFSLSNAVAITSPEAIFLFGGMARAGDLLLGPTKKYFEEYLLHLYKNKVRIEISALTEQNAAVLGASALVWNEKKAQHAQ